MSQELETKLAGLQTELKTYFEKAAEQQKALGTVTEELKTQIAAVQAQADAIDKKLADKIATGAPEKSFGDALKENESLARFMKDRPSGSIVINIDAKHATDLMSRKTAIDSSAVGVATSGVLGIERTPGIVTEARRRHRIRELLASRPTSMQVLDFVKVNAAMTAASPQIETHTKLENAVTFTTESERVRTLATWIPASRQILDDFTELEGFLRQSLPYYVDRAEETQLLTGSGSGQDLNGLITQATSFNTALLSASAGWNKIDIVGRAVEQIAIADEVEPSFIALNPADWWDMRLKKDSYGRYILGDPMGPVNVEALFGLTPVPTNSVTSGTFLIGSGSPAVAEIRDRMGMTIEIATQHSTYFTENMVAIRAEKRLALVVYRPGAFITGTFTTSP